MCISNSFPELRAYQPTAEEIAEEQRFYEDEACKRHVLRQEAAEAAVEMSDSPATVQGIEEGYEDLLPF